MTQPGGHSVAPYPVPPGGYGSPGQAPPPGFNMDYNPNQPAVMYQPGPVGHGPEYGGPPGGISPAPVGAPAAVPVGVPPGLEYLTQVGHQIKERRCRWMSPRLHLTGSVNDSCSTPPFLYLTFYLLTQTGNKGSCT